MPEQPNVIVLSADSLQYPYFSTALSEISDLTGAVEFTNAVATAPYTPSSIPTLAAGVYADSLSSLRLPDTGSPTPLAEYLTNAGYQSGFWSDNFIFGKEYGYNRGFSAGNLGEMTLKKRTVQTIRSSPIAPLFDVFEWLYFNVFQRVQSTVGGENTFYKSAESIHSDALGWIRDVEQPYFCWIHYMDTHHPYNPPSEYLDDETLEMFQSRSELAQFTRKSVKSNGDGLSDSQIADVAAAYRSCCEYLQDCITDFLSTLISEGYFDPETDIFVLTADHGECLSPREYGMMGHVPPAFFEEILHVPLAISRPDWERAVVDDQVSLVDILPTILDATELPIPENVDGRACSSPAEMGRENAIAVAKQGDRTYRSVRRDDGWKLSGSARNGVDEIILSRYDPDSPGDEEIVYTATDERPPDSNEYADVFYELLEALSSRGPPIEGAGIRFEDTNIKKEHLRDLGYL